MAPPAIDVVQMDPVAGLDCRLSPADLLAVLDDRLIGGKTHEGDLVAQCDRTPGVQTEHPRFGAHLHRFTLFDIG